MVFRKTMANRKEEKILLILTGEESANAEEAAFRYAKSNSKRLVVLHILTSHLYHYGHQDIIATRPSKRQFLLHIRDEILERGEVKARAMAERAQREGIGLQILSVESEDILSTAAAETKKGYDTIFLQREKRKLFPLFEKTLARHLRKKADSRVVEC
jgi:hypothetical protein